MQFAKHFDDTSQFRKLYQSMFMDMNYTQLRNIKMVAPMPFVAIQAYIFSAWAMRKTLRLVKFCTALPSATHQTVKESLHKYKFGFISTPPATKQTGPSLNKWRNISTV